MIPHARGEGLPFPQRFWGGLCSLPGIPALGKEPMFQAGSGGREGMGPGLHEPGAGRALEGAAAIPPGQVELQQRRERPRLPKNPRGNLRAGEEERREGKGRDGAGQPREGFPGWQGALGH